MRSFIQKKKKKCRRKLRPEASALNAETQSSKKPSTQRDHILRDTTTAMLHWTSIHGAVARTRRLDCLASSRNTAVLVILVIEHLLIYAAAPPTVTKRVGTLREPHNPRGQKAQPLPQQGTHQLTFTKKTLLDKVCEHALLLCCKLCRCCGAAMPDPNGFKYIGVLFYPGAVILF